MDKDVTNTNAGISNHFKNKQDCISLLSSIPPHVCRNRVNIRRK